MGDALPPDPYQALGLASDATDAQIKSAYRKLALKYHPDKVEGKGDEFHSISQAYELLMDEDRRRRYDDDIKYMSLKRGGSGGGSGGRRPSYGGVRVRTFERPQGSFDDEPIFRDGIFDPSDLNRAASSRKHDDTDRLRRTSAPVSSKAKDATRKSERSSTGKGDKHRESSERKKQRDRQNARGREEKFSERTATVESDDSAENMRTSRDARERFRQEARADVRDARRSAEDEAFMNREHKMRSQEDERLAHMSRTRQTNSPRDHPSGTAPPPPPSLRTSRLDNSSNERLDRDDTPKRPPVSSRTSTGSFVRPSRRRTSSFRDSPSPEPQTEKVRRPSSLNKSATSPLDDMVSSRSNYPPTSFQRTSSWDPRDFDSPPKLSRHSTEPIDRLERRSSSRREPAINSPLRKEVNNDSGYSTSNNSPDETSYPSQRGPTQTFKTTTYVKTADGVTAQKETRTAPAPTTRRGSVAADKYTPPAASTAGAPPPPPMPTSTSRKASFSAMDPPSSRRTMPSASQTMPLPKRSESYSARSVQIPPLKTGRDLPPGVSTGYGSKLFGEADLTYSPTSAEFDSSPFFSSTPSPATRRYAAENVKYSQGGQPDIRFTPKSNNDRFAERERMAREYMSSNEPNYGRSPALHGRGELRRGQTTA